MASPILYSTGAGGTTGDELATLSPFYASGNIWFVSSTTGSDSAAPRGKERERPLATIAQAITNAAAGDTIFLLASHAETLTASQTISLAGLRIVSEGTGTSRARFTFNGTATAQMFNITGAGVLLGNIYFVSATQAPTTAKVVVTGAGVRIRDCYFEAGASDTVEQLRLASGANNTRITGTTFISTSASVSSQPSVGISVSAAITDLVMESVTFDGSTSGWSGYAFDASAAAITRLNATNLSLYNGSDFTTATASVYLVHVANKSGSARLVLTA